MTDFEWAYEIPAHYKFIVGDEYKVKVGNSYDVIYVVDRVYENDCGIYISFSWAHPTGLCGNESGISIKTVREYISNGTMEKI